MARSESPALSKNMNQSSSLSEIVSEHSVQRLSMGRVSLRKS